jgi:hypothetical protein
MTSISNTSQKQVFKLALCLVLAWASVSHAQNAAPATPKDQVPVVDPFARNVNRPAQYGAVPAPKARDERKPFASSYDAQYHYEDDLTRLPDLRNYRVISIATKPARVKPLILGPDLHLPSVGSSPRKVYLRIYSHGMLNYARQFVFDFFETNRKMVDANFIIRRDKQDGRAIFRVDMGPFLNERHAMAYCSQVMSEKSKDPQPCITITEFQTSGEKESFKSAATVGLSASMVANVANTNKGLDQARLFGAAFDIEEGETLGRNNFVVIKITQRGIHLVGDSGRVFLLPADIIPLPAAADETE